MSNTEKQQKKGFSLVNALEGGDGLAHQLVAGLLLLLAVGILLASTIRFVSEIISGRASANFAQSGLNYLSDLLFGVIVLELLSTILTYLKARKLESTVKDFLVVGLISSVRKILLTGAQSSLTKPSTSEFVQESIGTVITIGGICLLIGALLLLDRLRPKSEDAREQAAST